MNKELLDDLQRTIQRAYPDRIIKVVQLADYSNSCPYNEEIDNSQSFSILDESLGGGRRILFGRLFRWTCGEKGWLLEVDYFFPYNPELCGTWKAVWLEDANGQNFDQFLHNLQLLPSFVAGIDELKRNYNKYNPLHQQMYKLWREMGFTCESE